MSDVWYYADDGAAKGPMSLSDLVQSLSVMNNPAETLVWRTGLAAWRKAADVTEVAERVLRSSPISSPRLPPLPTPPPVVERGFKVEPLPIGGWLILVALGQTLGPVRYLVSIGEYFSTMDWNVVQRFPAAFIGEALLSAAYLTLIVVATILFWRRSRNFPRLFVYETMATVALVPLSAVWVATTISVASGQPFNDIFAHAFEPKEAGRAIAAGSAGCLWSWYLYKSKRSAKTFVR